MSDLVPDDVAPRGSVGEQELLGRVLVDVADQAVVHAVTDEAAQPRFEAFDGLALEAELEIARKAMRDYRDALSELGKR